MAKAGKYYEDKVSNHLMKKVRQIEKIELSEFYTVIDGCTISNYWGNSNVL